MTKVGCPAEVVASEPGASHAASISWQERSHERSSSQMVPSGRPDS